MPQVGSNPNFALLGWPNFALLGAVHMSRASRASPANRADLSHENPYFSTT